MHSIVRIRNIEEENPIKINAICGYDPILSFEMEIKDWKELSLLDFMNKMENKLNVMHLPKTVDGVKRLLIQSISNMPNSNNSWNLSERECDFLVRPLFWGKQGTKLSRKYSVGTGAE